MPDYISKYFGHWIWYDLFSGARSFCEYEQLRFSIYSVNLVMIAALICVLASGASRRKFRTGIVWEARQIIPWLCVGLTGWVFQYSLLLSTFHPGTDCHFAKLWEQATAKYGVPLCSGVVSIAFFSAGSYLLQLKSRFHTSLRRPTQHGIQLKMFSGILGNEWARVTYVFFEGIVLVPQWTSPGSKAAVWLDALGNCFAHLCFGLGLLREMNREHREFVGMASALCMFLYGLVQLTALRPELFFDGYILAALLKLALVLTMVSFGTMINQNALTRFLTRREERRDFTELLIALHSNLQHDLKQPLKALDLEIATLRHSLPEQPDDLFSPARTAVSMAKVFFNQWPQRLKPRDLSLSDFFKNQGFIVRQQRNCHPYEVSVAPLFLEWAVQRLSQNAVFAKATEISINLEDGINERNEPIVIAHVSNNGTPLPHEVNLFHKPHGTWVARYLMQLSGGTLEREGTESESTFFRIELPAAISTALPSKEEQSDSLHSS